MYQETPEVTLKLDNASYKVVFTDTGHTIRVLAATNIMTNRRTDGQNYRSIYCGVLAMRRTVETIAQNMQNKMCSESANCAKALQCRRLVNDSISYKCPYPKSYRKQIPRQLRTQYVEGM